MNVEELRGLECLEALDESELNRLVEHMQLQIFTPHYPLFRYGEQARSCFFVLEGDVSVELNLEGERQALAVIHRGELIGSVAAVDGGTRSASCIAGPQGVRIARLSFQELHELLQVGDGLSCKLWMMLLKRIGVDLYRTELQWSKKSLKPISYK